jgi:hypothetical protein
MRSNPGTSALATFTSIAKLFAASSRKPCGAPAPMWQAVQIGVNIVSWILWKSEVAGGGGDGGGGAGAGAS